MRSEGRIGNTIGLQCSDFSSLSNVVGKADPGYSYGFIWATPKLYDLYVANGDNERFTWNIAPFTYRRIADRTDLGIVGRTFENKALYDLVKGAGWYGDRSYNYEGANEGEEYNSKVEQIGDVYKKRLLPVRKGKICVVPSSAGNMSLLQRRTRTVLLSISLYFVTRMCC